MKRRVYHLLMLLCLAGAVFSGYQVFEKLNDYRQGDEAYAELAMYVKEPQADGKTAEGTWSTRAEVNEEHSSRIEGVSGGKPSDPNTTDQAAASTLPKPDYEALKEINEDFLAWMYIGDTKIHYPVVAAENSEYYLDHLFDGRKNSAGCLFMEPLNHPDFTDRNTIIYGHHMKNGSMFAQLDGYRDQEFYDTHRQGWILTPDKTWRIDFLSAYVANVEESAWRLSFGSAEEYDAWLEEIRSKSAFQSELMPDTDSRIITLSTCSYEFEDARFVVHGVLTEIPEMLEMSEMPEVSGMP